jgi:hypothetical protein
MADTRGAWSAFLNPEVMRTKLISAGLFLVAHEMLLDSILRHPRFFFHDTFTSVDGFVPGSEYTENVLALDPKGKNDPLRGSIAWWRSMEAIDEADEIAIRRVTDARNNIAHEMTGMISGAKPPEFAEHFGTLMGLVNKIEKWWIINFEVAIDPDWAGDEIDEAGVVPGSAWMMDLLTQVALGEGDQAWELHRQFEELWTRNEANRNQTPRLRTH